MRQTRAHGAGFTQEDGGLLSRRVQTKIYFIVSLQQFKNIPALTLAIPEHKKSLRTIEGL
jgi:hypothetical protein